MKLLKLFFCLGAGLFCLQVSAMSSSESCRSLFQEELEENSAPASEWNEAELSADRPAVDELLLSLNSQSVFSEKRRLDEKWKRQVQYSLSEFEAPQLLTLLELLAFSKEKIDLNHEREFFKSILKETHVNFIYFLSAEDLVHVIWAAVELDIKSPPEQFVSSWRLAARKHRKDYTSRDRFILAGFFRQLGVSPLSQQENLQMIERDR